MEMWPVSDPIIAGPSGESLILPGFPWTLPSSLLVHLYWARFSHSQAVYILYKCQAVEIEHPFYVEICLERPNACDMKEQSLPEPQFPD